MEHLTPFPVDATDIGGDVPVSWLANTELVSAPLGSSIHRVAQLMDTESVGLVVLDDAGQIVAVVSERDVVRAVAAGTDPTGPAAVADGNRLWRVPAHTTAGDVAAIMTEHWVRHVLVVDGPDAEVVGVVSMRDLLTTIG